MKLEHYRAFIGYYTFWYPQLSFEDAVKDLKIPDDYEDIVDTLYGCGYYFDADGYLHYEED